MLDDLKATPGAIGDDPLNTAPLQEQHQPQDAGGTEDTPYYLASTDLPGGRLGVIVDTGAWTNLWGLHFAQRLAVKAHRASLTPTSEQLRTPLD